MAKGKPDQNAPPRSDELELSLFGPGKGECVVVHLGHGDWMVVDSCSNEGGSKAIALDYFERLGVDVGRQVKLVVVSHWHDDHIRGISQVVREATSARFVCSGALQNVEFFTLVSAQEQTKLVQQTSGMAEFAEILEILDRRDGGRFARGPDFWAVEGLTLYRATGPSGVEVHSLSPSAQTITDAHGELARLIPTEGTETRRFPRPTPNKLSVVLLVKATDLHFLLGGDLEEGVDERRGWRAVVGSQTRPPGRSSAYKVAHHGSENADHPDIWTRLVIDDPYALLAPYAGGRKPLPSPNDVQRIKSKTSQLFCTTPLNFQPPRRKNVDRTLNQVAKWRRAVRKRPGHIRLRVPVSGNLCDVSVALYDGASHL
jgi:hypothetical protein